MKKLISLITTLFLATNISITSNASNLEYGIEYKNQNINKTYKQAFSDVDSSYWAFNYIMEMCDRNVLSGYPNGKFYPNNNISRAEFSKIITIASGLSIHESNAKIYEDVEITDWSAPYIEASHLYLSGYQINGKYYYKPNDVALREDIAVALVKLKGYSTTGYDESMVKTMFTDSYSISKNAIPYVATAVEEGLISGYDDDTFRGQQGITRAEAAALLWRAYQYGNNNKIFDSANTTPTESEEIDKTPDNDIEVIETVVPKISYVQSIVSKDISINVGEPYEIQYNVYPTNATRNIILSTQNNDYGYFTINGNTINASHSGQCKVIIYDSYTNISTTINVVAIGYDYNDTADNEDTDSSNTLTGTITSTKLCDVNEINSRRQNLIAYPDGVIYNDGKQVYTCDYSGNVTEIFDIENFNCGLDENPYKKENINFYSVGYNYITNDIEVTFSCPHGIFIVNITKREYGDLSRAGKIYGTYKNGDIAYVSNGNNLYRLTNNGNLISVGSVYSDKIILSKNEQVFYVSENGNLSHLYSAFDLKDGKFYSNLDLSTHTFMSYSIGTNKYYSYDNGVIYQIDVDNGYGEELFKTNEVVSSDSFSIINMAEGSFVSYDGKRFFWYDKDYSCIRLIVINR